jgi:hypothetical protein
MGGQSASSRIRVLALALFLGVSRHVSLCLLQFGGFQSKTGPRVVIYYFFSEQEISMDLHLSTARAFSSVPSCFQSQFHLGSLFTKQLYDAVKRASRNARTGVRELMVTIFDSKQIQLARNCLCSSRSVNLSDRYHVFVALDSIALSAFLKFHPPVLFLNLSGRGFAYQQLTRVKHFIQLLLLSWNVETTVCDNDLVFLRNPKELFSADSHLKTWLKSQSLISLGIIHGRL